MKLHLPKSLLLSLLSALTLVSPLAVTLGSTAWAGSWNEGVNEEYNFTGTDDATELNTEGHVGVNGTFVKAKAPNLNITLTKITQVDGQKLTITGTWRNSTNSFNVLTVEELSMGDGSGSGALTIADDFGETLTTQRIKIEKISGAVTNLIVDTYGVLQLGAEGGANTFTIKDGTIESGGELHLIGGTYNITGLSNSGTVVMNEGSADVVLNNLVDKTSGKYDPSVITNTSTGNLVVENTGNKTLSGNITIANGGTVTLRGGTFGTSSAGLSNTIKTEAGTFLGFEDISVNIGGNANSKQMLDADIIVGNGATLTMTFEDRYHYNNKHTLKVLSGGSVVLGNTRQTLARGFIVELVGGTITGVGDSKGMALDFYNGGTIKVTENSTLDANTGGHNNNATITLDVANGKTLTMNGNFVMTAITVSNEGIVVYKGEVFAKDLDIDNEKGVFEYNFTGERTHTGSITGTGTLRKSGAGTLTLSSANTTVTNLAVTGGKLVYTVADEKTHTLSGTGGTFEKTGAGTLNLGALTSYDFAGGLTVSEGKVVFIGSSDEQMKNPPAFVKLVNGLTTVGEAQVEIQGDVVFNHQGSAAGDCVITLDDNIYITGNLEINSTNSVVDEDGDSLRRWNVNEGGDLSVGGHLWLTNKQKMVVSGGNVMAAGGIKLGHDQNDGTDDHHSKLVLESGSVTTKGVTFNKGENDVVMTGGELIFAPTTNGDQVLFEGSGKNRFTVTGGTLKATDKSWALTGTSTHVVSLGNATFDIAANKTITLSGSINLTGSMVVEGEGTLRVGDTTWNITAENLSEFSVIGGEVADSTQTNGLGHRNYALFYKDSIVVQQTGTTSSVMLDGNAAGDRWNADSFTIDGTQTNDFIINGAFSTAEATTENGAVGADVFVVNKAGVFTIAGDIADGKTVTQLLTTTMGSGEILLTTNTTLSNGNNMVFGGTLAIADGTTLNVGAAEAHVIDLSTLQEIRLDGGTIRYQANAGDVKHLNVTSNSLLHIHDMNSETMNVGKVSVAANAALTVNSLENATNNVAWNHQLNIGVLTGDGSAVFNGPGDPTGGTRKEGNISSLTINSLKGFTGDLTVSSREETGDKKRYNVIIKTGADGADFNKLDVSGFITQACTFVVEGNTSVNVLNAANGIVNLSEGVELALGDGTTSSNHSIGTVSTTVNGTIHLNNGATLNAFTKGEGSGAITLTGSGVYDLGNSTSANVSGLTDATNWTGVVRISNVQVGDFNPTGYANANSGLELVGVYGWLSNGFNMAGLLKLTKEGDLNGFKVTAASDWNHTFSGAVAGNGDFTINNGGDGAPKYYFTGDLSEWQGAFKVENTNANKTVTLNLTGGGNLFADASAGVYMNQQVAGTFNLNIGKAGETTNMRGAVINEGAGTLNVTVQGNTIFNADVDVSNLTITGGGGLTLGAGSELTVNNAIQNNGTLDIQGTVNWDLSSTEGLTVTYSEEELGRPDNGLGVGVIKGLITGSSTLKISDSASATVNGKNGTLTNTGWVTVDDVVYYVMSPAENEDDGYEYSMFGEYDNSSDVVYVGVHTYPGPIANAEANDALGFYVGENGILGIIGDSNTMSSGEILAQTQGEGTIILRAPGADNEKDEDEMRENLYVTVDSETQFKGNLSIATKLLKSSAEAETKSVYLHLEDEADISSFSSIEMGNGTHIVLDGIIEKSESKKGHINNLTNSGSGFTYLYINPGANKELVLGGNTTLRRYAHIPATGENEGYEPGSYMRLVFNQNAQVTIENLTTGGDTLENLYWNTIEITSAYETLYENDEVVNGIVNIESFDYLGFIYLSAGTEGSILVNLNLKAGQTLYDYQYSRYTEAVGTPGLTIKGEGTYILSNGNSINYSKSNNNWYIYNFGVLDSTWTGTVEVNNLDATIDAIKGIKIADYGNENSTIHFKGFKGYLTDDATAVEIKPDLILENTYIEEEGSLNKKVYEITGGDEGQAQTYTGDISGTGDFVVSAGSNMIFNLQGDISKWAADDTETPEFIVQNGTQALNFSGKATEVNAIIKVAPSNETEGATLKVSVGDADSAHTTTFNESVVASSLTTYTNTTAQFKGDTTRIGKVNLSAVKDAEAAVIEHGMVIDDNTVQGGEARNTVMSFEGEGYVSDSTLKNVVLTSTGSITELKEKVSINLTNLHDVKGVYLSGAVNFVSGDAQDNFKFVETKEAFGQTYNEVKFESSSFKGMTLQGAIAELGYLGNITLTVANGITVADGTEAWKGTDAPTNVSILLNGFKVEGLTIGERMEGMFAPLQFNVGDAQVVALSEDTAMSVSQLLNYYSYREVYFVQQEDGLFIRMSNIPEPTTATLSMLALAALASRRRRK